MADSPTKKLIAALTRAIGSEGQKYEGMAKIAEETQWHAILVQDQDLRKCSPDEVRTKLRADGYTDHLIERYIQGYRVRH